MVVVTIGVAAFLGLVSNRLGIFEATYLDIEYDSSGALVRLLMGFLPAAVLLWRLRRFNPPERVRLVWISFALANVVGLVALLLSPSTTAVDRIMLYFAAVQIVVFGEMAVLLGISQRGGILLRLLVLGYAIGVQLVWMLFATHASNWVPYRHAFNYL